MVLPTTKDATAAGAGFDTVRIIGDIDALAEKHAGHEDVFRSAVSRLLKAELAKVRDAAQAKLLRDRHGRHCAEWLCFVQDEIIRLSFSAATRHLYHSPIPSDGERMAVVATGGYGRGLMAPESDIDLLFILPYKQTAWGEQVAEAILYCLWDMGLNVGHATRSVNESIRQARRDMTVRTGILEARFLTGDRALYDELISRFDTEVVQGTAAEFVAAKLAEREERHHRAGQSRYLVEPNVKDGKGGLRDLHTLFWIAKYVYRVRESHELLRRNVFDVREYRTFRRCADFLWSVRCNLHFATGRAEERLSFDLQREIAVRLGYTSHPGMQDVERFMKHYFLTAKDVGDLTAILCAKLEDQQAKPAPVLSRAMSKPPGAEVRRVPDSDDFIIDNNRINLAAPDLFKRDPVNLIRLFRLAQKNNLAFHPDALRMVRRSRRLINAQLREDPESNRLFIEILTSNDAETVLRRMNETGVLGEFIRAFGKIVSMMQFNMYHHYTVDEHLIRCIGILQDIERGDNDEVALAGELMRTINPEHRPVIYIATLLHDVAKGRPEDHSIAGARVARRLCPRLGFNAADTELVAWLIEQHLTMSKVAQSRDLSDRKTIENFAAVVQSVERMKLLTILTTADIRGVGPGVWNGWKAQLLRTLYYETEPVLTGGFSEVNRAQRMAAAEAEFRAAFTEWSGHELNAYIARHYPAYWLKVDLEHKIRHARFLRASEQSGRKLNINVGFDEARGVTELTILAADHPWLLSIIAGACASAGANIVDAQIYTTTDGQALDTIAISREYERDEDEGRRAARIAEIIEQVLEGRLRLPDVMPSRAAGKRLRPFVVEPKVTINNQWSDRHTMIEVSGLDRPGLLFQLTTAISKLNLNIASAHVATFGERARDVFYVTDLLGARITAPTRQAAIKRALVHLLASGNTAE
ncbi:Protein-P-II uridylyltransferase [Nitrobacter winogradskyi Nb-255]|uniref:Bifunctional uridylyltransferase/uridylyl-removing enzyme n=1 Tax=Nitrobacter winogradskyi (strain ATCC 25391 / DSM 10237 / CIP 104748 / NCIMB 11846 / Nb-255) TaxID=323098 RepID=GLND_NITWN|nr:[protein-PII] uridylyltransferase [Nitrobacter winogradskyi]Q3SWE0.1 RecName: Full=Bifunctional uridylyltransferase/uridylyl-removing enzyme; Short=UTase/UR; AltName: Full=Bifunctional [protein-PII] modification enzyme; AltName: Full=Bifunctional nitrogen sensor protein; Includes: RecName: Full=[Protein-PII] uridylyltransferase; Short=PII uridylyltransferase; Short=UTase; Includes: RecName: Full=[Protein-PII]-UMP uridylyl-removing enzyme; Short=UR [Nitrobacter winogradskyi Nb-255]ABA03401.1 Pr